MIGIRNIIPDKVRGPPTPVLKETFLRRKRKAAATTNGMRRTIMPIK